MSDPQFVFHEATGAVFRGDWQAAAALCDPVSLIGFKRELMQRLEARQEVWTADRMLALQSDLPP